MKAATIGIAFLLVAGGVEARTLTASGPTTAVVGQDIVISFDSPAGQAINLAAIRSEWNEGIANFQGWDLTGTMFQSPLYLGCQSNTDGKMKFSTTGTGSYTQAGHIASLRLRAVGTGVLTVVFGNGCNGMESELVGFYNAGLIVPTDGPTASVSVTVTSEGICDDCELEATTGPDTPVVRSTWQTLKGLYR